MPRVVRPDLTRPAASTEGAVPIAAVRGIALGVAIGAFVGGSVCLALGVALARLW